jgi:hypothetical protein
MVTAFRMWFASVLCGTGPCGRIALPFIPTFLLATILPGCASVNVLMLSSETFTPQTSPVEILDRAPTRPYVQIAVLTVDSRLLSEDSKRQKILEKAATLGADAVVFGDPRLLGSPRSNGTAEQNIPSSSLPATEPEKVIPDDLHSFLQEGASGADVRIFLVRGGGGHGGGGGAGHGFGGHGGSRFGHSGFGHGRHFHGSAFFGFYGPGWWGYGPYYYGPYSYYGGYPYLGHGYMNNAVTFGTAIHYTD